VIDTRYENPRYMAENAGAADQGDGTAVNERIIGRGQAVSISD